MGCQGWYGTRPLLILRTQGPVDFVFDILDTEGRLVPANAFAFPTFGNLTENRFIEFMRALKKDRIDVVQLDVGDGEAGWIQLLAISKAKTGKNLYQLAYNRNHDAPTRFVTVAHELAPLFIGHLGADNGRRVPDRSNTPHALREVEAEMTAYLFRDALMRYWHGRCPITGITDPELLRASHMKPWRECDSDDERLDVYNGLLLSALWDAVFDKFLVTFREEGFPEFSSRLSAQARARFDEEIGPPIRLSDAHMPYLSHHRAAFARHSVSETENTSR